jgi:hypothetical protein
MVANMKTTVFWYMTPCSLIVVHRRFGGMYYVHSESRRVGQKSYKQEASTAIACTVDKQS